MSIFYFCHSTIYTCGPGSVVGIATGYGADGPGIESRWGSRFSTPVQTGPRARPASCTMGTGSYPGVKSGRGVTLNPHLLLVPWSRKGRAIPLLPLWAVRPVQSLSACTRVHFSFLLFILSVFTEMPYQYGYVFRGIIFILWNRLSIDILGMLIVFIKYKYTPVVHFAFRVF